MNFQARPPPGGTARPEAPPNTPPPSAQRTPNARAAGQRRPAGSRWKWLLALGILVLAGFLIYRIVSKYTFEQIVTATAVFPLDRLIMAGCFAAASYICLTGFDWLALHYAGRPLPYRKAALASFTSLSLGHNFGFAALSSGAVRYRFYSRWGLSAEQVAKVIIFCGVTVGLGLILLGGIALLYSPQQAHRVTGLEPLTLSGIGAICLVLAIFYLLLAATVRRPLTIGKWRFAMPPLRLAVAQVIIGPINFIFVAACLHQALAGVADVDFANVLTVYVIANVASLISHVPGGLGVIETVVTLFIPDATLIGAFVVFRFVYFLVPLALGAGLFAVAELAFGRTTAPTTVSENQ
ncbi:MAG: lysylphosphatidylglycerol synthase domain-containing protein [Alphaproteobacteria bacterium]